MTSKPVLAAEGVSLDFGAQNVLSDITMDISEGEFVCVVGPSGCGKTTLLRLFAGLYVPSAGSIKHFGSSFTRPRSDVAMVFQDYSNALLPWRTAAGNVALALEAACVPVADRGKIVNDWLTRVGLGNHQNKYPRQMSGGMQQRIQIARCLAQNPTALVMDEPFGALDAMTREGLQDELLRLTALTRAATIFVTHDLDEAVYLGDRVIGLSSHPGRIVLDMKIDLEKPRHKLDTRESERFLKLKHELYDFVESAQHVA